MSPRLKVGRACDFCGELYFPWGKVPEGARGYCDIRCRSKNQGWLARERLLDMYGRPDLPVVPLPSDEVLATWMEVDQ